MTTLEIVLIFVSVTETAVSAFIWHKWKKKLDAERKKYEDERAKYERLIEAIPTGRNTL